ncbi:conserved hypothetical protein [Xanthomonas campestris pv. campestris str. 8004]|uniref:Uncharacterized protein n=1 Tax=Xanthomonas campestris pv. campestris (strain 8004) TaxID=314565 RepID=A0A0H2X8I4_XANC8|nr:conserved hypothetical protein [Xanthomonas campestris pv. campestris str. 8004]
MCRLLPRSAAHTLDPIACADCSGYCKHDPEADVQRVVQQSHTQRLTRDSNALVGARLARRSRECPSRARPTWSMRRWRCQPIYRWPRSRCGSPRHAMVAMALHTAPAASRIVTHC